MRFLALAFTIAAALCAVGLLPTRRFAGEEGVPAMIAGCGVSFVSASMAGLLLVMGSSQTPEARMQRSFLAMVVRLLVVVVLGAAAALSGVFARQPLLFWIATAYVALLPLEVRLAI